VGLCFIVAAMTQRRHMDKVLQHAEKRFVLKAGAKPSEHLKLFKQFLKLEEHRLRMEHGAGGGGRAIAQERAQMMDVLVRQVFKAADSYYRQAHLGEKIPPVAILAHGGYGRAELSPHSDIDIMFLHDGATRGGPPHPYLTTIVEQVLYMLWDVGLKVGHATRTIAEAIRFANQDMQSKTAFIEARLLLGDKELFEQFRRRLLHECVRGHVDEYIAARVADQSARHEKYGDTVYLQEPNLKSGCGGLRDFQNLIWMAFFKYGALSLKELRQQGFLEAAEQRQLEAAYDYLLRVRAALHYHNGRACDVINLGFQPHLATDLGYRQHDLLRRTEAFMRDYYTHARNIFLLTNAAAERMALKSLSRLGALLARRSRPAEEFDGFKLQDGVLSAAAPAVFKEDPHRLLRVFLHAQQRGAELGPDLRSQIRHHVKLADRSYLNSPATRDTFLAILQHKGQVARVLRQMHEVELLGKVLPEFGRLTCLVQHEFFHRYTADEHTLQVVEHLDRIIDAVEPPHANYRKIFQQLERPHILYLAVLLHDVGKAANVPRHAEASVDMARKAAARLRLSDDETSQIIGLVRDHLKLSLLSQRRDIDDHATIDAAVRVAKTEANLDRLLLLTFADSIGVGAKAWSDWKEALLWEIYHRTQRDLTGTERRRDILSRRIEQIYKEVSARLKHQLPLEEIYSHFELMPAGYYINTSAEEVAGHLRLIHGFIERQLNVENPQDALAPVVEWRNFAVPGHTNVSICTWDRLGLFSKICGAFAAAELNVLSAHIYTRGDQVVLDMFDVCDKQFTAVTDPKLMRTAETMLQQTLTDREEINFEELLQKMRAARGPTPAIRVVSIPTVIGFDNDISQNRTIIEIQTENRLGLLYTITKTMSDLGLDISFAKIATEKGAAIDSFYVQDQSGQKIINADQLANIRARLESALNLLPG
jgi:[protein-PII] uridylyltransferase